MKCFLVGGHITKFTGKNEIMQHRNLKGLIGEAIGECLKDLCEDVDVERVFVGNFAAELFNEQGHLGASVSIHKGLMYKPSHRVEAACASGGVACVEAIRSIRGGLNDVVLAIGGMLTFFFFFFSLSISISMTTH